MKYNIWKTKGGCFLTNDFISNNNQMSCFIKNMFLSDLNFYIKHYAYILNIKCFVYLNVQISYNYETLMIITDNAT